MKNIENINEFIEKLKQSEKLIIVEGKKDKNALEFFGITQILTLEGKALFQVVEKAAEKSNEIIILTDFDKKGKQLYGRLSKDLQKHGIKVDKFFREWLQKNTKLSHVEGLKHYIEHNVANHI